MTREPFSTTQLLEKVEAQKGFLDASILAYDAGVETESLRMAVAVRVLVHRTKNSHALLAQLSDLNALALPNTGEAFGPDKEVLPNGNIRVHAGSFHRLARGRMSQSEVKYIPKLDEIANAPMVGFSEWWDTPVLRQRGPLINAPLRELSRKDVVLGLANKEGGAHVDPNPHFNWWMATRSGAFGSVDTDENGNPRLTIPVGELALGKTTGSIITPVHATMRVIAAELCVAISPVIND